MADLLSRVGFDDVMFDVIFVVINSCKLISWALTKLPLFLRSLAKISNILLISATVSILCSLISFLIFSLKESDAGEVDRDDLIDLIVLFGDCFDSSLQGDGHGTDAGGCSVCRAGAGPGSTLA